MKLYSEAVASSVANIEAAAYHHLSSLPALRRRLADGPDYLITEYLEGRTLAEAMKDQSVDLRSAVTQVFEYIRGCSQMQVDGFGVPDETLRGSAPTWAAFLERHLQAQQARIAALPTTAARELMPGWELLFDKIQESMSELGDVRPSLVPVDLNLANFLLRPNGRIAVLDLKTFWLGDPLVGLGEWYAHTYGSPAFGPMVYAWRPKTAELARIRFYALLATIDITLFVLESDRDPREVAPWGNAVTFASLERIHSRYVAKRIIDPARALLCVPELGEGWSAKPRTGQRWEDIGETHARLERVRHLAGVTRLAEITPLDRTQIPVYQAVRPEAEVAAETFTVFSGRGADRQHAQVAALAEAIERFCGERRRFDPGRIRVGTPVEVQEHSTIISLEEFNLPANADYGRNTCLEWVPAVDLMTSESVLVPACAVFYPYTPPEGLAAPMRFFTTGFGAGTTLLEAVNHGLAEVVERDAAALNRILRNRPAVSLGTIDAESARNHLSQLESAGLRVVVRWIAADDVGIPAFSVICEDAETYDSMYISGGYGAHPDKEIALVRALQEAAASRVGTISGAREDLSKFQSRSADYAHYRQRYAYWFDTDSVVDYRDLPTSTTPTVLDDLADLVTGFSRAALNRILVVDLTRPEFALRVVKVLVPGVERYSFQMTCVGVRGRTLYERARGRPLPLPPLHEGLAA